MVSLVVPGSSERMLQKAAGIDADEIVIDLEDAVIPERKAEALGGVLAAIAPEAPAVRRRQARGPGERRRESLGPHRADRARDRAGQLDSIVVPKVQSTGDLAFVERLLAGAEAAADDVEAAGARRSGSRR